MPKIKTRKSASKRFKSTGSGQVKRPKAYRSQSMVRKTRKRKRVLRQGGLIHASDLKRVKTMGTA
jgi:large subunit ribosomal protein L35